MKITEYNFQKEFLEKKDREKIYKDNLIIDGDYKRVVPLSMLYEWAENPKKSTVQDMGRLEKMTRKLGQFKSLVVEETGQVLGGNHRLLKWRAMGFFYTTVEVVYPQSEDERVEYALADNDHIAEYDQELLAEKLKALKLVDIDLFKVNLAPLSKLSTLLDRFADTPPDDELPDTPSVPMSKTGELYQLGRHRLICGDALEPKYYQALMDNKTARMVFTDPPYNVNYKGHADTRRDTIANDNMSAEEFRQFLTKSLKNMMSVCDGAFYVCMSSQELYNLHPAFTEAGGHFQAYIIWVKNHFTLGGADFQSIHEPILYGWNKNKTRYYAGYRDEVNVWVNMETVKPIYENDYSTFKLGEYELKIKGKVEGEVTRRHETTDIWCISRPSKSEEHPTMKPIKLVSKAIRMSSERGDIVLDPFGRSGSTLIAAETTERTCYMIELDPKFIDVIIKRYENFTGEKAIKLATI